MGEGKRKGKKEGRKGEGKEQVYPGLEMKKPKNMKEKGKTKE